MSSMQSDLSWWERCLHSLGLRREREPGEDDAAFDWEKDDASAEPMTVADIPAELKERLQLEALRSTFFRLENQLRFLLRATFQDDHGEGRDEARNILWLWRQGLEQEARLAPDTYPGAVRRYEPEMAEAYFVPGQCQLGDPLRIVTPCWRLDGGVVVRGEAEPYEGERTRRPYHDLTEDDEDQVLSAADRAA